MINIKNSLVQKELKESDFVIKSTVSTKARTTFFVLEFYFYPLYICTIVIILTAAYLLLELTKQSLKK